MKIRFFALVLALLPLASFSQTKISALPPASTITGTEKIPADQGLSTIYLTPAQIAAFVDSIPGGIDLSRAVSGNLSTSHLNGGANASATTFWNGTGTWSAPVFTSPTCAANQFLASPNGAPGVANCRALVGADIPATNLSLQGNGGVISNLSVLNLGGGIGANPTTFWRGDGTWAIPTAPAANPTALVGLAAVNGVSPNFMRADSAPPLNTNISPTMMGSWTFHGPTNPVTIISPPLGQAFAINNAADTAQYFIVNSTGTTSIQNATTGVALSVTGSGSTSAASFGSGAANSVVDFDSSNGNGPYASFSRSGSIFGYVGDSGALGGTLDNLGVRGQNGVDILTNAGTHVAASFSTAGNMAIAGPSSGAALTVNAGAVPTSDVVLQGNRNSSIGFEINNASVGTQATSILALTDGAQNLGFAELQGSGFTLPLITGGLNGLAMNLGTFQNFPLQIITNKTLRGTISGAGNWALAAPDSGPALTVAGSSSGNGTGVFTVNQASGTGPAIVANIPSASNVLFAGQNGSESLGLHLSNSGAGFLGTFGAGSTLALGANGASNVNIGSAGNVSIAGTATGNTLTVGASTGSNYSLIVNAPTNAAGIGIFGNTNGQVGATATQSNPAGSAGFDAGDGTNFTSFVFQGSTDNAKLTNGPNGLASVLYTASCFPLTIGTNFAERMRITCPGNVTVNAPVSGVALTANANLNSPGILVNSPNGSTAAAIQASGNSTASVEIQAQNTGSAGASSFVASDGTKFAYFELQGSAQTTDIIGGINGSALNIGSTGAPICFGANHNCALSLSVAGNLSVAAPSSGPALALGGPLTGTTGAFTGAITGAGYSGGPLSATTGAFSALVNANLGLNVTGAPLSASGPTAVLGAGPLVVTGTSGNGPEILIGNTGTSLQGLITVDPVSNTFVLSATQGGTVVLFSQLSLPAITTTTTAPAAGAAAALPATPAGYMTITIDGVARKVAFY